MKSANIKIAKMNKKDTFKIAYLRFSARTKELVLENLLKEKENLYGK